MKKAEVTISIKYTPIEIISAFIDPQKLADWWQVEKTLIDPKPGGLYTLAWAVTENGMMYVSTGFVKLYQPESELVIENFVYLSPENPFLGPMRLTIRAREKEGGTELFLCQDGYRSCEDWDLYNETVRPSWPDVMETLKDYLEAKP